MKELARGFEAETGTRVRLVFGSTGMLFGQLTNGAPLDVFFAADQARPQRLHHMGLARAPLVYARGSVVLWTAHLPAGGPGDGTEDWAGVAGRADLARLAVANPETAPYGAAAVQALEAAGLYRRVAEKLVFAQNVAQAFQWAHTGAADAGFVAASHALSARGARGRQYPVPGAPEVVQAACVLESARDPALARDFVEYVRDAAAVLERYGYR
jgi:molybdate transport system substrate-binding protein